ncbi:MAG: transketolase [Bacteroidetes bacterium]|nr:transketolase [Bacteroidota bacterium]
MISEKNPKLLQKELRKKILDLHFSANAGHIGCSLSCIDILIATLVLQKKEDDIFILSKGHAASALYVCLNHLGEISNEQLKTFYKNGTALPAHPAPQKFKSIPFGIGSLGHGFSLGAGVAKAKKISEETGFVFVVMSDGETNEGTTWEAGHFARQHKLDNLLLFVDKNKLQGFGETKDVLGDTCKEESWTALGFDVYTVDGHNIEEIINKMEIIKQSKNDSPKIIIAETIKGKGVSFMENKLDWHYLPMSAELYQRALKEILEKYSL